MNKEQEYLYDFCEGHNLDPSSMVDVERLKQWQAAPRLPLDTNSMKVIELMQSNGNFKTKWLKSKEDK